MTRPATFTFANTTDELKEQILSQGLGITAPLSDFRLYQVGVHHQPEVVGGETVYLAHNEAGDHLITVSDRSTIIMFFEKLSDYQLFTVVGHVSYGEKQEQGMPEIRLELYKNDSLQKSVVYGTLVGSPDYKTSVLLPEQDFSKLWEEFRPVTIQTDNSFKELTANDHPF